MLRATLGEPIPLQVLLPDGQEGLYVIATVSTAQGALVAEFSLEHQVKGLYSYGWTPTAEGYYSIIYDVYMDQALQEPAGVYDRDGEQVEVTSEKTNLTRLLGLQHENSVVDQQTYSPTGKLLTARVRAYDSTLHAALSGTEGLRYTWTMQAQYNPATDQLENYRILRSET